MYLDKKAGLLNSSIRSFLPPVLSKSDINEKLIHGISFLIDLSGYEKFYEEFLVPIQELDVYIVLGNDHLKKIISYAEKNRNLRRLGIMRYNNSLLDGHFSRVLHLKAKSIIPIIGETKRIKHFVNK